MARFYTGGGCFYVDDLARDALSVGWSREIRG